MNSKTKWTITLSGMTTGRTLTFYRRDEPTSSELDDMMLREDATTAAVHPPTGDDR
jgi:hypothetical protein